VVDISLLAESVLISASVEAGIVISVLYIAIAITALAIYNGFWQKVKAKDENYLTVKEIELRKEKNVQLKKLVKLGLTPSKQQYVNRSPRSRAANTILTPEQKMQLMKLESTKGRRVSRYFDVPVSFFFSLHFCIQIRKQSVMLFSNAQTFRRNASNEQSQADFNPEPPAHIKRTEVILATPVKPPAPTDHLKKVQDDELAQAWEEFFNEEHQASYWVNKTSGETTWHKPKCLNVIEMRYESRQEVIIFDLTVLCISKCFFLASLTPLYYFCS
jgi:hypothetical protein